MLEKNHLKNLLFIVTAFLFASCIREEVYDDSQRGNFEQLWKIIDEQYCFFEHKKEVYGLDWNEVHDRYSDRIVEGMSEDAFFAVMSEMLQELRDGHVNLVSKQDMSRYWSWFEDYPDNFDQNVVDDYLGTRYKISSGFKYRILEDNIAYVYYGSFSSGVSDGALDEMLDYLAICDGLIFDVRNNGGGLLTNANRIAERFTNETVLTGYMQHKTGKGHDDFSDFVQIDTEPDDNGVRWQKNVVVLTNRRSYSATNDFVNRMRQFPLVTVMGDKTGGGSGMPFSSEISNGWSVRFSSSPTFGPQKEHLEFGIEPDVKVDLIDADKWKGVDTIIERAREFLKNSKEKY